MNEKHLLMLLLLSKLLRLMAPRPSYNKKHYTLREMLSWPAIDSREIVRHSLNPAERLITSN